MTNTLVLPMTAPTISGTSTTYTFPWSTIKVGNVVSAWVLLVSASIVLATTNPLTGTGVTWTKEVTATTNTSLGTMYGFMGIVTSVVTNATQTLKTASGSIGQTNILMEAIEIQSSLVGGAWSFVAGNSITASSATTPHNAPAVTTAAGDSWACAFVSSASGYNPPTTPNPNYTYDEINGAIYFPTATAGSQSTSGASSMIPVLSGTPTAEPYSSLSMAFRNSGTAPSSGPVPFDSGYGSFFYHKEQNAFGNYPGRYPSHRPGRRLQPGQPERASSRMRRLDRAGLRRGLRSGGVRIG